MRTAIVGLGWWGGELATAARRTQGAVEIAAGCSPIAGEREAFAARFGCPATGSFAAILADPEITAVMLATPHSLHAPHAIAAARAGKHVLVEKPLAVRASDAAEIVTACALHGVTLAVGHNRRLLPQLGRLASLLRDGSLGDVLHVEANFSTAESLTFPAGHWRTLATECPGGAMTVLGVHVIDWLHHLLGPVAQVSARFASRAVRHGGDDTACAWLTMRSGVPVTLVTLYASSYVNRFAIHGSNASVLVEAGGPETPDCRPNLRLTRRDGRIHDEPQPYVDTLGQQLALWASACRGEGLPAVGGVEAARNVAVLEALVRSATAAGAPVSPDYGMLRD